MLLDGDDLCSSAHVCWVVSIIRHFGFYAQPRARTHELDLAGTGSGIVEAGCCDRQGAATLLNIAGNH